MTTFEGGPADDVKLALRNAQPLLRVTFNPRAPKHPWDALDQPGDEPAPHEQLYVYELTGEPFWYHVSARGKGAGQMRGYWPLATYRYLEEQPDMGAIREGVGWTAYLRLQRQ